MPAGLENPGLDGSHPPANTPGGMSDGGPRSNYSDRAHSPSAVIRQEEEEEEVMVRFNACVIFCQTLIEVYLVQLTLGICRVCFMRNTYVLRIQNIINTSFD